MAKFITADGLTKVSFEYEATTEKIQAVVGDVSEALFDRGQGNHGNEEVPVLFTDLSNQDKLDLVDTYVKDVIINMANAKQLEKAKAEVSITEHKL